MTTPRTENRPRNPPPEKPPQVGSGPDNQVEDEWDCVDEAAWESFPASDAPAGWAGKDRPTERATKTESPKTDEDLHDENRK